MYEKFNLLDVQNAIGYVFKNAELIKTAFVHKSYEGKNVQSNARQVLLGEKLLNLLVCDYVCTHSSAKGEKQLKGELDNYLDSLAPEKFIKNHSLTKYVTLSNLNEPLRDSDALCRELFCAIVSAIYKDGGLPALKAFLMPMLRCIGDKKHYEPSLDGKVESRADAVLSSEKHIPTAKIRVGAKPTAISITKAQTLNTSSQISSERTPEAPKENANQKQKKESSLARLLKKKEKELKVQESIATTEIPAEKHFIRDAFAPVRLSDDLRNFKPKKQAKAQEITPNLPEPERLVAKTSDKSAKPALYEPVSEDNYKSLLQETIQRNVRTPSVLIKYDSKPQGNGSWMSSVSMSGKALGTAIGDNKKSAEKAAAEAAYKAIITHGSPEHKFFVSLCTGEVADTSESVDYISKINQYFQKSKHSSNAPITYEKRHSREKNIYMTAVIYEGQEIAAGKGSSPKESKQNAARVACEVLKIK